MIDLNRGCYGNQETLGSEDVEKLHTTYATAPKAKVQDSYAPHSELHSGIMVSREFATESVGSK